MIKSIALNKLMASPRNVRRVTDEQADLQLKADIEARGLLQNLVVTSLGKPRGAFAVEAGGRRLRALHCLAEEGKLAKDHEVCCLVVDGDEDAAREASLAENFQRLGMNPADECVAFQQLIEHGADAEAIARRFGLTVRFVEGRLRLAALAPTVFEALGAGEISLDVAKAYAATSDLERQAHVFEQMSRGYGGAHPDSIRRMMTQATASGTDRRALFVGEQSYLAAGGRIERDLFSDDSGARWLDIALLERLASEKLEGLASEAAEATGLGWVRPTLEPWISYAVTDELRRMQLETPPLSEAETAEVETLEAGIEELSDVIEDEESGEEERRAAEARIRELTDRIDAIADKPPVVGEDLKPRLGAFLMLDEFGRAKLDRGRFVSADDDECHSGADDPAGADPAKPEKKPGGLSQRLVDELSMQRRDILAIHVAADAELAFDLAAFLMADGLNGRPFEKDGSSLSALPPSEPVVGFKTPEARATLAAAESLEALDRSWTSGETRARRLDAFRALPREARLAWLGHALARTLEASLNLPGPRSCPFQDHLGRLLHIDIAGWWRPTCANYFDRVSKSVALAALEEVGGTALASLHSGSKKAELAQACERIFAGEFIAEAEVKERALAWVPEAMQFAADPEDGTGDPEAHSGHQCGEEPSGDPPSPTVEAGEFEEAA